KTDMVKIWLDGAAGLMPKIKPDVYSAVIDEAHKNGLRVAAHIYDLDDAKAIVRAGVDVIAHGVRDKPVDSEFIDMMKARSVWYISTIVLDYTNYVFAEQPSWMRESFFQRALHPTVRAQLDDPDYRERTLGMPATAKNRVAVATNEQNLKAVHDAGIRIGFGSDSGVGLRIPGVAEHLELALMVEAGLTPMQAITNATSNAAALLKLDDRGVLTSGKLADLVVLEGDHTRHMIPPKIGEEAAAFLMMNRNKRGIVLDLKTEGGKSILRRLIATADVLVENFAPGVMERLGFGYEDLRKDYPSLIYCSLSGFGRIGPYKHRRGFDLVAQAMSGIM